MIKGMLGDRNVHGIYEFSCEHRITDITDSDQQAWAGYYRSPYSGKKDHRNIYDHVHVSLARRWQHSVDRIWELGKFDRIKRRNETSDHLYMCHGQHWQ